MMFKAVLLFLLTCTSFAHAENLGERAQTYEIDRDARESMRDIVRKKTETGEVAKYWQDYRAKTINAIKNPAPLGIPSNYQKRAELRDLRYVIPSDFHDQNGNIVVRKGTVVEPLKALPLTSGLLFIDGRDQRQVDYAIARGQREPLKIVLVAGSYYDLRVKYKDAPWQGSKIIPFYFDQRKMIINTLQRLYGINIASVPAALTQRGTQLSVEFGL